MNIKESFTAGGLSVSICGSNTERIFYLLSSPMGDGPSLPEQLPELPCSVVSIGVPNWNDDLTPWPAKRVFRKAPDFKGLAADFLRRIAEEVVPAAEEKLGAESPRRCICGGSLGGLFAVWSLYETDLFDDALSNSGSMWYDDFLTFAAENTTRKPASKLYLSLGDEEKLSTNARFAKVESCTLELLEIFKARGTEAVFRSEPGDHFTDHLGRLLRGMEWMLAQ